MAKRTTKSPVVIGEDGIRYHDYDGVLIPEPRGRKRYDESELVALYIQGRLDGLYKNHSHGAKELMQFADIHSGGKSTKIDRLRRKFGYAWKHR